MIYDKQLHVYYYLDSENESSYPFSVKTPIKAIGTAGFGTIFRILLEASLESSKCLIESSKKPINGL